MRVEAKYGLGLLAGDALLAAFPLLPLSRWALVLVEWIRGAGVLGVVVYALTYIAGHEGFAARSDSWLSLWWQHLEWAPCVRFSMTWRGKHRA